MTPPVAGGPRWGMNLPIAGLPLRAHRDIVTALPELGYTDVWTAEGAGQDAFTPLAAAAAWQPALRIGTGVVPVFTRGAGVLAQTAMSLTGLTDGDVLLGLGTSVEAHVTGLNQIPYTQPVARLRDTVRFLKRAVRGERIDESYETFEVRGFQLASPPPRPPRIVVGALRPRLTRFALTEADGAITNVLTDRDLHQVLATAGPIPQGKELIVKLFVCPTADAAHARRAGRAFLGWITNQRPYRDFHDWLGRGPLLAESRRHFDAGDHAGAAAAIPDAIVDALWLHGSPAECHEKIKAFVQPGVTTVLLYVLPTPELRAAPDSLAQVLRALRGR